MAFNFIRKLIDLAGGDTPILVPNPERGPQSYVYRRPDSGGLDAIPAAFACVAILSRTLASLPLVVGRLRDRSADLLEPDYEHPVSVLLDAPSTLLDRQKFWELICNRLFSAGNSYAWIRRGPGRRPVELVPAVLNKAPEWVSVEGMARTIKYELNLLGSKPDPLGRKPTVEATAPDVLAFHMDGFTGLSSPSPIHHAARRSLETMRNASVWQDAAFTGTNVRNAIETDPELAKLPDVSRHLDQFEARLRDSLEKARQDGLWPVFPPGYSLASGSGFSPADLQTIEVLKWGVEDVARVWLMPPRMIGHFHEGFRATRYEAQQEDFERICARPNAGRIQAQCTAKLLAPAEKDSALVVRMNTDQVGRGSWSEEVDAVDQAVSRGGLLTPNEGRRRLGYPPLPGGDVLLSPKGAPPQPGAGSPSTEDPDGTDE